MEPTTTRILESTATRLLESATARILESPQQGPWSQPSGPPRSQQNTGQPYRNDVSQGGSQQNAEQRQVQTPTPQLNQPTNQNTSQRPTNPTYAEVSTAQQGGETAQTQTENQTQKN